MIFSLSISLSKFERIYSEWAVHMVNVYDLAQWRKGPRDIASFKRVNSYYYGNKPMAVSKSIKHCKGISSERVQWLDNIEGVHHFLIFLHFSFHYYADRLFSFYSIQTTLQLRYNFLSIDCLIKNVALTTFLIFFELLTWFTWHKMPKPLIVNFHQPFIVMHARVSAFLTSCAN